MQNRWICVLRVKKLFYFQNSVEIILKKIEFETSF